MARAGCAWRRRCTRPASRWRCTSAAGCGPSACRATACTSTRMARGRCTSVCRPSCGGRSSRPVARRAARSASSPSSSTELLFVEDELTSGTERDPVDAHHSVSRITLHQVLSAGLDGVLHHGKEFERYERAADGTVTLHFADGTTATADVLVAADGANSRVRGQYLPHAAADGHRHPRDRGQVPADRGDEAGAAGPTPRRTEQRDPARRLRHVRRPARARHRPRPPCTASAATTRPWPRTPCCSTTPAATSCGPTPPTARGSPTAPPSCPKWTVTRCETSSAG